MSKTAELELIKAALDFGTASKNTMRAIYGNQGDVQVRMHEEQSAWERFLRVLREEVTGG